MNGADKETEMAQTIETYRQALREGDLETMGRCYQAAETDPDLEAALAQVDEEEEQAALPALTAVDMAEMRARLLAPLLGRRLPQA